MKVPILIYSNEIPRKYKKSIATVQAELDWNGVLREVLLPQSCSPTDRRRLNKTQGLNDNVESQFLKLVCSTFKRCTSASCWFSLQVWCSFFQVKYEQREEERKAQAVELNNLESLIYKVRRDDVVKQNRPLLDRLTSLLEWVDGKGPSAGLDETKSKIEKVTENVSFIVSLHEVLEVFR